MTGAASISIVGARVSDEAEQRCLLISPRTRGVEAQGELTRTASELTSILALALVKAGSEVSIHEIHVVQWTLRGDTHVVEPRATLSARIVRCETGRAWAMHDRYRDTAEFPTESARPMRRELARATDATSRRLEAQANVLRAC